MPIIPLFLGEFVSVLFIDVNDAISVAEFVDANLFGPPLNLIYVETEIVQTVYVETFGETRIKVETET